MSAADELLTDDYQLRYVTVLTTVNCQWQTCDKETSCSYRRTVLKVSDRTSSQVDQSSIFHTCLSTYNYRTISETTKKLICRRQAARRSMSLKILLSRSRSLKVVRNYTLSKTCESSYSYSIVTTYVSILYHFWHIQHKIMACPRNNLG